MKNVNPKCENGANRPGGAGRPKIGEERGPTVSPATSCLSTIGTRRPAGSTPSPPLATGGGGRKGGSAGP